MSHTNLPTPALECVRALAQFSGLMHDIGKLTQHFQNKLKCTKTVRDAISHEWISAWILAHMLERDSVDWDGFLAAWDAWEVGENGIKSMFQSAHAWRPFERLDSFSSASLMVVATHHRLFSMHKRGHIGERIAPDAGLLAPAQNHVSPELFLEQNHGAWLRVRKWLSAGDKNCWKQLLERAAALRRSASAAGAGSVAYWHKAGVVARAAMVLADQHVSALRFSQQAQEARYPRVQAYANSMEEQSAKGQPKLRLNQPLSWHLAQVGDTAALYAGYFAEQGLPSLSALRRELVHGDRSTVQGRFFWQDEACDFVRRVREEEAGTHAFLVFNVAGTGAGKTRANVRLLEECRPAHDALRITAGFNLKALTLQTATAYRRELNLANDEFACIVGDPLARALHAHEEQDDQDASSDPQFESAGCESEDFWRTLPHWLQQLEGTRSGQAHLLAAPVLVCTMDYLVAAGDPSQQAHHAYALLRIAHSDLLIDEADSYDPEGLVAVLRVVQMAGMFGRNVMVSSATLAPVLAEQIQRAWASGMFMHRAGMGDDALHVHEIVVSNVGGERGFQRVRGAEQDFNGWYSETLGAMYATDLASYRMAQIVPVEALSQWSNTIAKACLEAHENHHWQAALAQGTVQVSVGVVRMANVKPLQDLAQMLAQYLWPEGCTVKLCVYHAQDVAMRRYFKEQALDLVLKRHGNPDLSAHSVLQPLLADLPSKTRHVMLLVLASPIEEIGRDHDFDWAVVEPSSMHALIQLAGRVNRHRLHVIEKPNVFILDRNLRGLEGRSRLAFTRPGLQQADSYGKVLTHHEGSAMALLQPASAEPAFSLDARLIFNANQRCRFAQEDEKAIQYLLQAVQPSFEPDHAQWACDWLYVRYPLRAKDEQRTETWMCVPRVNKKLALHRYERTVQGFVWCAKAMGHSEERLREEQGQWLCPDLHELDGWMQQRLAAMETGHSGAGNTALFLIRARQFSWNPVPGSQPVLRWSGVR